jgi:DNA-binding NarL/FixJ family response regulator
MINIIVADHQAIFRAGIAKILAVEDDLRVVGQPPTLEQLLICIEKLRAKVLVISSGFTGKMEDIHQLTRRKGITMLILADNAEAATRCREAGIDGVVYRSVTGDHMVEAVRRVARGEGYFQLTGTTSDASEDLVGTRVRDRLSDRELNIMASVVRGSRNRDIALQLHTSEQVVKNLLHNIFDKTGVSDRLELALFVLHHRVLAQATASVKIKRKSNHLKGSAAAAEKSETTGRSSGPTIQ